MENLSEHRDHANKMDGNELRTTFPIDAWLRETCQRFASRDAESTGGAALARGVANRD
jgi:hypothetical protein